MRELHFFTEVKPWDGQLPLGRLKRVPGPGRLWGKPERSLFLTTDLLHRWEDESGLSLPLGRLDQDGCRRLVPYLTGACVTDPDAKKLQRTLLALYRRVAYRRGAAVAQ